jgi:3-oxoadipate CoA-transferase alpha subunit
VPQGNLAADRGAAGRGIGAFSRPTGYGTPLAEARRRARSTAALRARDADPRDFALIKARPRRPLGQPRLPQDRAQLRPDHGDRGALHRRAGARGRRLGGLDPEAIVTPGIFVRRVVPWAVMTPHPRPDARACRRDIPRART